MSQTYVADELLWKHKNEILIRSVDFADQLAVGESLTGTPTVTCTDAALVIDTISKVGTKVEYRMSVGTPSVYEHAITVTCGVTGGAAAQTYIVVARLRVGDSL